ncbi:MAG: patatin-like phospholipase family protein [Acetobacteraceae bacterium]|nr:patatin-like phospholipase family protein [Acetobacteraceae bacterium]
MAQSTRSQAGTAPVHALVLQGGGALGAYQAGAYQALAGWTETLDWVAGISIGAVNAALIAGNPPDRRVERLNAFWERVSLALPVRPDAGAIAPVRGWWDNAMALWGASMGVPGFFRPRSWLAWWPQPPVSWYDTEPLHGTLCELVDFDYLNDGPMRFSVGAVDVQNGNFTYFDNRNERIGPEHVLASGALPPGFGAVQVGEHWYWDGGLVSNTPLGYVMGELRGGAEQPVTVFQVDLFCARGRLPETLADAAEREKDIRYSSRTRLITDLVRERHQLHRRLHQLAELLPKSDRDSSAVQELLAGSVDPPITLVHVIHRRKPYETQTKDYEFSRLSMTEHWQAGRTDMAASLEMLARQEPPRRGQFREIDYQPDAHAARVQPARPARRPAVSGPNRKDTRS